MRKVFKIGGRYGTRGSRPASVSKPALERQAKTKLAMDHGWHPEEVKEAAKNLAIQLLDG